MAHYRSVRQELTVKYKITPTAFASHIYRSVRGKHPKDNLEDLSRVSDRLTRGAHIQLGTQKRTKAAFLPCVSS